MQVARAQVEYVRQWVEEKDHQRNLQRVTPPPVQGAFAPMAEGSTATCIRTHEFLTNPCASCSACCIVLCWSSSVVVVTSAIHSETVVTSVHACMVPTLYTCTYYTMPIKSYKIILCNFFNFPEWVEIQQYNTADNCSLTFTSTTCLKWTRCDTYRCKLNPLPHMYRSDTSYRIHTIIIYSYVYGHVLFNERILTAYIHHQPERPERYHGSFRRCLHGSGLGFGHNRLHRIPHHVSNPEKADVRTINLSVHSDCLLY